MSVNIPFQPKPPTAGDFKSSFTSTIPMVFLVMKEAGTALYNRTPKNHVDLYTLEAGTPLSSLPNQKPIKAEMHVRGESTASAVKPQYSVHVKDTPEKFINLDFTGDKWVFNDAGVVDKTLIRNPMAFELQSGLGDWAPKHQYFELFICSAAKFPDIIKSSGEAATQDTTASKEAKNAKKKGPEWDLDKVVSHAYQCYQGVYINLEKVTIGAQRVNITPYAEPIKSDTALGDLSIQMNHADVKYVSLNPNGADPNLPSTGVNQLIVMQPEAKLFGITSTQAPPLLPSPVPESLQNILNWFDTWGNIFADNGTWYMKDPKKDKPIPPKGYADTTTISNPYVTKTKNTISEVMAYCVDFDSMANYLLLAELAKDPDGLHRSMFMYKKGDKVYGGAMWDKNKSFGNVQNYGSDYWYVYNTGWTVLGQGNGLIKDNIANPINPGQATDWWRVFLTSSAFCKTINAQWQANTVEGMSFTSAKVKSIINTQMDLLCPGASLATLSGDACLKANSPILRELKLWWGSTPIEWLGWCQGLNGYMDNRITWMTTNLAGLLEDCSGYKAD